jgi:hypothetical protein
MEFGECSTSKVVQFTNLFDVYDRPHPYPLSEPQRKSPSPAEVLLKNHGMQENDHKQKKIVFIN